MKSEIASGLLPILIIMTAFGFIVLIDCIKGLSDLSLFQFLMDV